MARVEIWISVCAVCLLELEYSEALVPSHLLISSFTEGHLILEKALPCSVYSCLQSLVVIKHTTFLEIQFRQLSSQQTTPGNKIVFACLPRAWNQ
jgi:hypothetical protein